MVGGVVIETIVLPDRIWINCRDKRDTCAIYVERNAKSEAIRVGDKLWWQGREAMWTPASGVSAGWYDLRIPRIGYSGLPRPGTERA